MKMTDSELTSDAATETPCIIVNTNNLRPQITIKKVSDVEKYLDMMEKVSLVYLLYDDNEIALQHLIQLTHGADLKVVTEWCSYKEKFSCKWQDKLLEALTIIQNFFVIHELGYHKNEVCDRFLPSNPETSLFIDLYRKKLYCIFEKMTNAQMNMFLEKVQLDFNHKNLEYKTFKVPYMEMYLLYWTSMKYISPTNFNNLCKIFKALEMYEVSDSLKTKSQLHVNSNCSGDSTKDRNDNIKGGTFSKISSTSVSARQDCPPATNYENMRYPMDPVHPGICLIINQELFYTEPDPKLSHLLPIVTFQLDARKGSACDRDELSDTFGKLGYTVEIQNNLTHCQILKAISDTADKVKEHSSFIVCILSHGLEGKVFGVNSIPVNISQIRDIVCSVNNTHLRNKPKILIIQSCQGIVCQTVSAHEDNSIDKQNIPITNPLIELQKQLHPSEVASDSNFQMDGGLRSKLADVLLFWATVPGFGAVRDTVTGSWFIQSLCKHIKNNAHKMHFGDICTLVQDEVSNQKWTTETETRVMLPYYESTLVRFFYLPSFKTAGKAGLRI